jgi:hypothetical protein
MAKSALELAVETGKWNSGLKKAKSALDNFTQSQGGLQQALGKDSEKIQQFVRMMGQADSTAKTAKGQMNDYKSTIEQLTMQYNRLTDAQKKTLGQDYLRAIDQMKQKYQGVADEVDKINKSLKQTSGQSIGTHGVGGLFSGDKLGGMMQVFGGNLMTKAAGAVAQLGSEMADMVKQGVEMAKAGEGIRIAFERLGRGDILQGLREATHGTVTDIELMKAAVKFNDFKLPLDELGTMLAFAQQKAKDTGQSVDYMVDSIVTGLGRKSLMILDNLGLSATEVKDKMKETGDMTKAVGAIIREQMEKAGDYVETAADRAAQANVRLQNKMEELGRKFAPVEEASNQLWTSMKIGILDIVGGPLAKMLNQLTEAGRLKNALNNLNGVDGSGNTKVGQQLSALRGSNYKNAKYRRQLAQYDKQISTYQTMIDNGGKLPEAPAGSGKDVRWLRSQMDALKTMRSEYVQGAKKILQPIKQDVSSPTLTSPSSGGNGGKTDPIYAKDSIAYQEKLVSDLTKKWKEAGDAVREGYAEQLGYAQQKLEAMKGGFDPTKMRGTTAWATSMEDMKRGKDRKWYDATAPVAPSELTFSDGLQNYMKYVEKLQVDAYKNSAKKKDGMEDSKKVTSGLNEVASGLQQMGIMLPQEVQQVLGVINGLMTVIEGVNTIIGVTQAAELTANTAAMVALTSALWANTATSFFPGLARGGIVPHAANGYFVPGTHYSNDVTPIMANAGELVLNRAQQGNLAAQLGGGGLQDLNISAIITGEQIRLVLNNNGRRTGRGEYVTTNFRRYGD